MMENPFSLMEKVFFFFSWIYDNMHEIIFQFQSLYNPQLIACITADIHPISCPIS